MSQRKLSAACSLFHHRTCLSFYFFFDKVLTGRLSTLEQNESAVPCSSNTSIVGHTINPDCWGRGFPKSYFFFYQIKVLGLASGLHTLCRNITCIPMYVSMSLAQYVMVFLPVYSSYCCHRGCLWTRNWASIPE